MIEVRQTGQFAEWLDGLRDGVARKRIAQRILRLEGGLFGDAKPVGGGVSELRVDHGPGYRLYFTKRGLAVVILLCGGDKSTQSADIRQAREMAAKV
ncbi:MAG: type II toxin-antitoxin system RelE/ParE family toxin [Dehalococcoidia bacterium]